MTPGYRFVRALARCVVLAQMRLRVHYAERVPRSGGVLLVSNHLGLTDPLAIGARLPREMRMLGKTELFGWLFVGWAARRARAIPIRRGESDRQALGTLLRMLRDGECVLIFPEGTYAYAPDPPAMLPLKTGAAWLALRAGVPVVPVGIWGTERVWHPSRGWRLWHRPRVEVVFGEPYTPAPPAGLPTRAAFDAATEDMARRIAALLPPSYRGHNANALAEPIGEA